MWPGFCWNVIPNHYLIPFRESEDSGRSHVENKFGTSAMSASSIYDKGAKGGDPAPSAPATQDSFGSSSDRVHQPWAIQAVCNPAGKTGFWAIAVIHPNH